MLDEGADPSLEKKLELGRLSPGPPVDVHGVGFRVPRDNCHSGAVLEDVSFQNSVDHEPLIETS